MSDLLGPAGEQEERPPSRAIQKFLLIALVAVAAIGVLAGIGDSISQMFEEVPVIEEPDQ